jgi:hypothetical protein
MKTRNVSMMLMMVVALCLGACASIGIQTDAQRIAVACATASASVNVLTAASNMGKLDDDQRYMVLVAISAVSPICTAEVAPTLDDVKREAFMAAIAGLQLAATQVSGGTP